MGNCDNGSLSGDTRRDHHVREATNDEAAHVVGWTRPSNSPTTLRKVRGSGYRTPHLGGKQGAVARAAFLIPNRG